MTMEYVVDVLLLRKELQMALQLLDHPTPSLPFAVLSMRYVH